MTGKACQHGVNESDLRTRIAGVIARMNDCWCEDCRAQPDEFDLLVADAVIRELRIGEIVKALNDYEAARRADSECGEADNSGNCAGDALEELLSRIIGWKADE